MTTSLQRKHYLKDGICPNCKKRPIVPTHTACEKCREANHKWMEANKEHTRIRNKVRYDRLVSLGLCVSCKKPTDGRKYCQVCQDKINARRAYYKPLHSRNKWSKR